MKRLDLHFPGIYKFTNKINGKIYVGQAGDIYMRRKNHMRLDSNTLFGKALKKYGFNGFDFDVLERVDNLELLNEREQYWMDFYQCYNKKIGYNICAIAGSTRGRKNLPHVVERTRQMGLAQKGERNPFFGKKHTDEVRSYLSAINKGKPGSRKGKKNTPEVIERTRQMGLIQKGEKNPFYGRKHSIEARSIMSAKAKGRTPSEKTRQKASITARKRIDGNPGIMSQYAALAKQKVQRQIAQLDPITMEIVKIWACIGDIYAELKLSKAQIGAMCRGPFFDKKANYWKYTSKPIGGFYWQYLVGEKVAFNLEEHFSASTKNRKYPKIAQLDAVSSEVIKIWDNAADIARNFNVSSTRILNTCKGKYFDRDYNIWRETNPVAVGFKWQYA